MHKYKSKVKSRVDSKNESKLKFQDALSVKVFKEQLDRGNLEIGSSLFTGDQREIKIIKQLCSYLGYKFIKKDIAPCCLLDSSTSFDVVHYIVEE